MTRPEDKWVHSGGLNIRYRVTRPKGKAKARVIILPGFTEFIEKHADTAKRFGKMGMECLVLDWPGQGLSGRLSPSFPHLVHCDDFTRHLDALDAVLADSDFLKTKKPVFVFGHSMGGHLALRFANDAGVNIAGIILTAPLMMPPVTPPRPVLFGISALCGLGFGLRPVPGQQCKPRDEVYTPDNPLTRNPEGYGLQVQWWRRNPALKAAGPSFGWVRAAYRSCLATTGRRDWLGGIDIPVQAHLAGDETVVAGHYSARLLAALRDAEVHHYEDAKHELLIEMPDVVERVWQRAGAFVKKRLGD